MQPLAQQQPYQSQIMHQQNQTPSLQIQHQMSVDLTTTTTTTNGVAGLNDSYYRSSSEPLAKTSPGKVQYGFIAVLKVDFLNI